MDEFGKSVKILIVAICVALFAVGIIWNLFYGTLPTDTMEQPVIGEVVVETEADWEEQYTAEKMKTVEEEAEETEPQAEEAAIFFDEEVPKAAEEEQDSVENQIAALRMKRDSSWQQLKNQLESLEFEQKQQCLKQYEELQYKEQRLEVLLQAKGISDCLVLLEEQQANIIADGAALEQQYEKIFDLVQRNTDYLPEQIVIVPLTNHMTMA